MQLVEVLYEYMNTPSPRKERDPHGEREKISAPMVGFELTTSGEFAR